MVHIPPSERLQTLLSDFIREVWSCGDIERCEFYLADSYTIHHDPGDPWDGQMLDLEGFKTRVRASRAPFPDQQFQVPDMIAYKNRVMVTWNWMATPAGDLPGFPATGRKTSMSGATVYYFDINDKITGHWQIADRLGVFQQLQRARRI
jgi:predicted ester cyclase